MLLEKNLKELVRAGRCRTLRAAVWDRNARLAVGTPAEGEGCYYGMFVYETPDEDVQAVDAVTMTELIVQSGFPEVDILKVDIEGAEVSLFRGELSWLTRVRTIAIEFHGNARERAQFDSVMDTYGFHIDDSNPHTVIATRVGSHSGTANSGRRCMMGALAYLLPASVEHRKKTAPGVQPAMAPEWERPASSYKHGNS
jgi:FkbM family methyltransferase